MVIIIILALHAPSWLSPSRVKAFSTIAIFRNFFSIESHLCQVPINPQYTWTTTINVNDILTILLPAPRWLAPFCLKKTFFSLGLVRQVISTEKAQNDSKRTKTNSHELRWTKLNWNRKTERQKDRKTERQKDRKTERQKDRKIERQKDRKTERQKDRKAEGQKEWKNERMNRTQKTSRRGFLISWTQWSMILKDL